MKPKASEAKRSIPNCICANCYCYRRCQPLLNVDTVCCCCTNRLDIMSLSLHFPIRCKDTEQCRSVRFRATTITTHGGTNRQQMGLPCNKSRFNHCRVLCMRKIDYVVKAYSTVHALWSSGKFTARGTICLTSSKLYKAKYAKIL